MDEQAQRMRRTIESMSEDLHLARRSNKIAAIVTDTCRENLQAVARERGDQVVPLDVVLEMLEGILAALAGKTDCDELRGIHPEVTPLAYTRIQALLDDGPRLIGPER